MMESRKHNPSKTESADVSNRSVSEDVKFNCGNQHKQLSPEAHTSQKMGPSEDSGKALHQHYDDWNPMQAISDSFLNTVSTSSDNDLVALATGVGSDSKSDILCPFDDGSGRCYKSVCTYKHGTYSSKQRRELPKLNVSSTKTQISNASLSLPSQILPARDCISKVAVTAAYDPGHFFVVPETGWNCLCSIHDLEETQESPSNFYFYEILDDIQLTLKQAFKTKSSIPRQNEFVADELVAVSITAAAGDKSWYRAKVLNDAIVYPEDGEDLLAPVEVELELIDYGIRTVKSSADIAILPSKLCQFAPLAFKCQLFGVSPLIGTWGSGAVTMFENLVRGQQLVAEVVQPASPNAIQSGEQLENDASLLNLYVKPACETSYIDVASKLIEAGYGLEWNLFPTKPSLNNFLGGRAHRFALRTKDEK